MHIVFAMLYAGGYSFSINVSCLSSLVSPLFVLFTVLLWVIRGSTRKNCDMIMSVTSCGNDATSSTTTARRVLRLNSTVFPICMSPDPLDDMISKHVENSDMTRLSALSTSVMRHILLNSVSEERM